MAKIYENGVKMTNTQVAEILMNEMPDSHKKMLKTRTCEFLEAFRGNHRMVFAHSVLDLYKLLPTTTEAEEKSKKYCKFLMERYMKSSTVVDGEDSVIQLLVEKIVEYTE